MKLKTTSWLGMLGAMLLFPTMAHATITYLGVDYEQATWNTNGGGLDSARSFSFPGFASGVTGTATASAIAAESNSLGIVTNADPTGFTNFPFDNTGSTTGQAYYSPTTFETNRKWLNVSAGRDGGSDVPVMSLTFDLTGNTATQRFIIDFLNLDNATAYFVSAKDINDNVYTGAALKALISPYLGNYGSPLFDHDSSGTYYKVNASRSAALNVGLQDAEGYNGRGAGGSILVNLALKQLVLEFDDLAPAATQGDGFQMTLMAVPEPSSLALVVSGLVGLALVRRRRRRMV